MKSLPSVLSGLFFGSIFTLPVTAQISPDGTTSTTVTPTPTGVEINNGDVAGGNLFHSFGEFSVPTGSEAFFNNASDISNIFSRVTGGDISNIDGLIRANGTANLFLINPAGILFGENASLQLGGSFYGSTADSILFPDGEFSATDLDNPPLITINAPIGLGFRDNPGDIINRSAFGLSVSSGETIGLIGGNVSIDNGIIFAPEAAVELGGLTETGTIQIAEDNSFVFPENVSRGNLSIANSSFIVVSGADGGSITINAKNLDILSGSTIFAGIGVDSGSSEAQARDIKIDLTEDLLIDALDSGQVTLITNSNFGTGNALNIEINARNITFQNGGNISSNTVGQGDAGSITLNASGDISFNGTNAVGISGIFNFVQERATGNVGSIDIQAQNLNLIDGGQIISGVSGEGNSGDINLNVEETITVDGFGLATLENISGDLSSRISSNVFDTGIGNAGNINIETENLVVSNGGAINVSTEGRGNAGNLSIFANDLAIDGGENGIFTELSASVEENATGTGGNITIGSETLSVANGGFVLADTSGLGDAGDLNIFANSIEINGGENGFFTGLSAQVAEGATGSGGNIILGSEQVLIEQISLNNGAQVSASTFGQGDAGNLAVYTDDLIINGGDSLFRTGLSASTEVVATGSGGNITLGSEQVPIEQISLNNGAQVLVNTFGLGDAGNLTIFANDIEIDGQGDFFSGLFAQVGSTATGSGGNITIGSEQFPVENLRVTNGALVTADTFGQGDGGQIEIAVNNLSLNSGGQINATTLGEGDSGTITIEAGENIVLDGFDSGIFNQVNEEAIGEGGSVFISTDQLSINNNAVINVSSFGEGNVGDLNIFANSLNLNRGEILANNQPSKDITDTASTGNITLEIADDITLRNNSLISAENTGSSGGNVSINAGGFIIAFPSQTPNDGNDILATAIEGTGGNITLAAQALFNIEERQAFPGNGTNDIEASANLNLDLFANTPDNVDLDLSNPELVQSESVSTVGACAASNIDDVSSFTVNGKGGVPPEPTEPFDGLAIITEEDLTATENPVGTIQESSLPDENAGNFDPGYIPPHIKPVTHDENGEPIYIARGLIVKPDGGIILTAYPTPGTPGYREYQEQMGCNVN